MKLGNELARCKLVLETFELIAVAIDRVASLAVGADFRECGLVATGNGLGGVTSGIGKLHSVLFALLLEKLRDGLEGIGHFGRVGGNGSGILIGNGLAECAVGT